MNEELQNYINYLKLERSASPYTVRNYSSDLKDFLFFLSSSRAISPLNVDRNTLRGFINHLNERGIVKASIARKLSAVRSFYHYLAKRGLIDKDPLLEFQSPKLDKRLPGFLTHEEMEKLLNSADEKKPTGQRDSVILELLYASGIRVSEITQLDINRINLTTREIWVIGKGLKERAVLMGEPAVEKLQRYISDSRVKLLNNNRSTALFINKYGKRLTQRQIQNIVAKHGREAGLNKKVHPHLLRHTFATHLLDGGADLRVVQELLGHATLSTTQVYTHLSQSQTRRVYLAAHPLAHPDNKEKRK